MSIFRHAKDKELLKEIQKIVRKLLWQLLYIKVGTYAHTMLQTFKNLKTGGYHWSVRLLDKEKLGLSLNVFYYD